MASNTEIMKVRLTAEGIQDVVSAMKKVEGAAKQTKKSSEGIGSNLRNELRDLGIGVALRQLGQFVQANIEAQAAVQDLVEVSGASAEAITTIGIAARKEGVSVEALSKGVRGLTKFMAALQGGSSEATETLDAMGLSSEDLVGKSMDQQLVTIANALDQFSDEGQSGMNKAALAMKIFGKSGSDMLQVLQRLSGDGFQKIQEEGRRTGQVLSGDAALAAKKAKEEMENLAGQVEGATNAFTQGLIPALGDAVDGLTDAGDPKRLEGFKKIGETVGWVAKGIASAFVVAGHTVAYLTNFISQKATNLWEDVKGIASLGKELFTGKGTEFGGKVRAFEADRQRRRAGEVDDANYLEGMENALNNIWFPSQSETSKSGAKTKKRKNLDLGDSKDSAKAAKEAYSESLAAIKRLQESQKQLLQQGNSLNEHSYEVGLTSLAEFQARRRELLEIGNQQELEALQGQLNAEVRLGKEASATKIKDLQAEIEIRKQANEQTLLEDLWKAEAERKQAAEDAQRRRDESINKSMGIAHTHLSTDQERAEQAYAAGAIGRDQYLEQKIQAYQEWLDVMRQIQATMQAIAEESGDESLIAEAQALQVQIDGCALSAANLSNKWADLQTAGAGALATGMVDTLMSVGDGLDVVGGKFQDMALNAVKAVQEVLTKMLLLQAAEAMLGGYGAGTWQNTLLKGFTGALGFASGGAIRGSGTGTSDSIPIWASNGEFMQPARAVSYYGEDFMQALRGLRVPRSALLGYADGGLVGSAKQQPLQTTLDGTLRFDMGPGMEAFVLNVVKSPAGVRVQAQNAAANPRRMNRALGNGRY